MKEIEGIEFWTPEEFEEKYESPYFSALAGEIKPGDYARFWPDRDGQVVYKDTLGVEVYLRVIDLLDGQEKELAYDTDTELFVRKPEPTLEIMQ